jgi:hypothetical protein
VFYASQNSKDAEPESFAIRVKNVSASSAQTAAQGVSTAAQSAAAGVNKGVRQGVYTVRVWAAPRLESAAYHTTNTVAPKVSSALKTSAQQVRPVEPKKSPSALTWSLLAAAVLATAGAVAALVRYRYRAAMTTDDEEDFAAGSEGGTPASAGAQADSTTDSADAGVNGRVSASGW